MFKRLKFAGIVLTAGFALAAIYSLVGPKAHTSALSGSVIISTGVFDGSNRQVGMSIPGSVDTPAEFKTYVNNLLYNNSAFGIPGSSYNMYGAAFIVETMLHGQINYNADNALVQAARADYATWANYIDQYAAAGRITGLTSFYSSTIPAGKINSMHVCDTSKLAGCGDNYRAVYNNTNGTDAHRYAFYTMSTPEASTLIIFTNPDGTTFQIRRECANVIGSASKLGGWTMSGRTTATNETSAARGSNPYPGDKIRFSHYVKDQGPSATGQDIWFALLDHPSGAVVQGGQNSGQYSAGQEKLVDANEVLTIPLNATTGTQYCRKVLYDWAASNGSRNGIGAPACVTVIAPYNLNPSINVQINGGATAGNFAEPGDTITFTYAVNNSDNGASSGTNCTIYGLSRNNYYAIPSPVDTTSDPGFAQPAHGCPRNFPANTNTVLVTETVPAASVVANKSICRTLVVSPASPTVASRPVEACAYVATKPYVRTYGGDISAGGGVETAPDTCPSSTGAAIIGWNKRSSGGYAGAGVQFAAYAMSTIFDAASSLGASAGTPTGLSFANTSTSVANGRFGGSFGSAPCIPDYYGARPATVNPLPASIGTSLASGAYGTNPATPGNYTLGGGTVQPGVKATLYVNGNLFISSNIIYGGSGSWSSASVPSLRIIVLGNIFIDNDVTQLDGLYVAQPNGASGVIHTCALNSSPYTPISNNVLTSQCNKKLTVNGSFAAQQIRLLRTAGTLRQSDAAETSASNNIAEVFNYNPALWIVQPPANTGAAGYDSINSLPPVL